MAVICQFAGFQKFPAIGHSQIHLITMSALISSECGTVTDVTFERWLNVRVVKSSLKKGTEVIAFISRRWRSRYSVFDLENNKPALPFAARACLLHPA